MNEISIGLIPFKITIEETRQKPLIITDHLEIKTKRDKFFAAYIKAVDRIYDFHTNDTILNNFGYFLYKCFDENGLLQNFDLVGLNFVKPENPMSLVNNEILLNSEKYTLSTAYDSPVEPKDSLSYHGTFYADERVIWVRDIKGVKGDYGKRTFMTQTLWHEILHGLIWEADIDVSYKLEEEICSKLSVAITESFFMPFAWRGALCSFNDERFL